MYHQKRLVTDEDEDNTNDSMYNIGGVKKQLKKNNTVR